ncbi:MAG: glycosyltransferase [Bacteroidales bacterium]|jgi:hypothetical protein|nr:glycosyltransferase [Bacteroidales bacterium]
MIQYLNSSKSGTDCSVVVSVFNEEEGIRQFIQSLSDVISTLKLNYEIIFVDDGKGNSVICMDSDLQHPPKMIHAMYIDNLFDEPKAQPVYEPYIFINTLNNPNYEMVHKRTK